MVPIIDIAGLKVHTYLVAGILAWIAGSMFFFISQRKEGKPTWKIILLLLFFTAGFLFGSRIFAGFSRPELHTQVPVNASRMRFWLHAGESFYGALLGGLGGAAVACIILRLQILMILDSAASALMLMLGICKLGCLLGGCCWGNPTLFPLALEFHDFEAPVRPIGVPLHATQLYEMTIAMLIFILLVWANRKKRLSGLPLTLALTIYPVARFIIEFLRGGKLLFFYGLTINQWMSLLVFAMGLFVLYVAISTNRKDAVNV